VSYVSTYHRLWLACLDQEGHDRTVGYWYTITTASATAHTAFRQRSSLLRWVEERGLSIIGELPAHGVHQVHRIEGTYRTALHADRTEFDATTIGGIRTRTLGNGDWTLAIITTDPDGDRTVHTLACSVPEPDRPVFDRLESEAMLG